MGVVTEQHFKMEMKWRWMGFSVWDTLSIILYEGFDSESVVMKIFMPVLLTLLVLSHLRLAVALPGFQEVTPPAAVELIAVAWSPDGTMIAGGGTDGMVRVWDAFTNAPLLELVGDPETVYAVAWSPDSTQLASGGPDGFTRIWNINGTDFPAGHLVAELEGLRDIVTIAWSPDGTMIASGSQQGEGSFPNLFIWDASNYGLINEIIIGAAVDIEWQPNNNHWIAVADQAQDVFVFAPTIDLSASRFPRLHEALTVGPDEPATEISWNSDGTVFAFGSEWGEIYIVEGTTGDVIYTIEDAHTAAVTALAWTPDDQYLASASNDNTLKIWDVTTWELVSTVHLDKESFTNAIVWSPDGDELVYGDVGDRPVRITPTIDQAMRFSPGMAVADIEWSPDGELLAVSGEAGVKLLDTRLQEIAMRQAGSSAFSQVSWSPDSMWFAVINTTDDAVMVWQRNREDDTFTISNALYRSHPRINAIKWSPDGSMLAVLTEYQPKGFNGWLGDIEVWNTTTWRLESVVAEDVRFTGPFLEWSADSQFIIGVKELCDYMIFSCYVPTLFQVSVQNAEFVAYEDWPSYVASVSWAKDGRLAVGWGGTIIYSTNPFEVLHEIDIDRPDSYVSPLVEWNADASRLLISNRHGIARIMDMATIEPIWEMDFWPQITMMDWSPDERMVAYVTVDGVVEIQAIPLLAR